MKTLQFEVNGTLVTSTLMCAWDQCRLARLSQPFLPAINRASDTGKGHVRLTIDSLLSSFAPLAATEDKDAHTLIEMCMVSCGRIDQMSGDAVPLDRLSLDLPGVLRVIAHVVTHNLGPLFALERPTFQPVSLNGGRYEPATMPHGEDWPLRPVLRRLCLAESLYDGTLRIEHIAKLNDLLDVADENERRAYKAAEGRNA